MTEQPAALLAEAQALHQAGRLADAARRYEAVLKRRPEDAAALMLLGALRLQQGDALAASKLLRRAADRRPQDPTPRYNLGIALNRLGRHGDAAEALEAVVAAHPGHADAWKSLGDARRGREERAGAIAAYREALRLRPDFPAALLNLGALLADEGEIVEAESCARRLVAAWPGNAQGWNNLGLTLMTQRLLPEAEAAFRRAVEIAPDYDTAIENLGRLVIISGRPVEGADLLRRALDLQRRARKPLSGEAFVGLLEAQGVVYDWSSMPDLVREVLARETEGFDPFILLVQDVAPQRLRRLGLLYGRKLTRGAVALPQRRVSAAGPVRLGYISADFRNHAVASLVCEALELHDRGRFTVHAYATKGALGSHYRARIAAGVDVFREVHGLGDDAIGRAIAEDGIDILVDLGGWTADTRARAVAMRPAPVQASWLGYAASMGVPWIDYVLLDPIAAPPGCEEEFSEKIVRLPDCFQPNDRQRPVGPAPSRAAEGLPEDGFVFAAFASAFKVTPKVFDVWMRVLAAVPGSVLWTKDYGEPARSNLRREAEARGIAGHRIVFAHYAPDHAAHLGRYRLAGVALDTWPYGSHTTASDALWGGCPLIALRGTTLAARISSSVLSAAGLPDLVADDVETFVALATHLATDADALATMRARAEASRASPLFDTPRFVRHLEAAYLAMHDRAAAGLPPAAITLPRD